MGGWDGKILVITLSNGVHGNLSEVSRTGLMFNTFPFGSIQLPEVKKNQCIEGPPLSSFISLEKKLQISVKIKYLLSFVADRTELICLPGNSFMPVYRCCSIH